MSRATKSVDGRSRRFARSSLIALLSTALLVGVLQTVAPAAPPASPGSANPADATSQPPVLPNTGGDPAPASPPVVLGDMSDPPVDALPIDDSVPDVPPKAGGGSYDPATSTLSEQTETANIYMNADGTQTVAQYAEPVNVEKPDGSFVPVDLTLVTASAKDLSDAASKQPDVAPQNPGKRPKAHPLNPVFGSTAGRGTVSAEVEDVSIKIAPVDAPANTKAKVSGDTVMYPKASEGSDVVYELGRGTVKESIMLAASPGDDGAADWSFWLDINGDATPTVVETGAVEIRRADGSLAFGMPIPYVFDSAGVEGVREPSDTNGKFSLEQKGSRWVLTVSVDRGWLNDPERVYPVAVDPTLASVGYDSAASYKSDGTVVQGAPMRTGNPNDGGRLWRGISHFNLSGWYMWGHQVIDAQVYLHRVGGTPNGYGQWMWHAGAFSFAGNATFLGSTQTGFENDAWIGGSGVTTFMRSMFEGANNQAHYMYVGDETPGIYSYKQVEAVLYVNLNQNATAPTIGGPADGATFTSVTPTLTAQATDPEGDPVYYQYVVGEMSSPELGATWTSPWTSQTSIQVPDNALKPGTKYYWRAYSRDHCHLETSNCGIGGPYVGWWSGVKSFTTNAPPLPLSRDGASPIDGAKTATTTPTLTVQPSGGDPDGGPNGGNIRYWFSVATGADAKSGVIVSSGWLTFPAGTAPTWTVPAGYLKNGITYTWKAWADDGLDRDQSTWSNKLTIEQRIGDPKAAPTDSLGAATVNLANGNLIFSTASPTASFAKSEVGLTYTYNSQAVGAESGMTVTYYNDANKNGQLDDGPTSQVLQKTEPAPNANWNGTSPLPGVLDANYYIADWKGFLQVPADGTYLIGGSNDDALTIKLTDAGTTKTLFQASCCSQQVQFQTDKAVALKAGVQYPLSIQLTQATGPSYMDVHIKRADNQPLPGLGAATDVTMPTSWLSTAAESPLPTGWTLSTDIDGDATYTRATVAQDSITIYDAASTPHIYERPDGSAGGSWTPPLGEHGVLTVAGDGTISLQDEDGTLSTFNKDGSLKEYLPADTTGSATALKYTYTGTPARASEITDPVSTMSLKLYYGRDTGKCGSTLPGAPANKLCSIVYPDGSVSYLQYNVLGQLVRILDPGNELTDFSYNTAGVISGVRDASANDALVAGVVSDTADLVSQITYATGSDGVLKVSSIKSPKSTATNGRQGHSYTYQSPPSTSADGVTLVKIDGLSPVSGYATKATFDVDLRTKSVTDALGRITYSEYNAKDLLLKTTTKSVVNGQVTDLVTSTVYDWADRPIGEYGPAPAACFPAQPSTNPIPTFSGTTGYAPLQTAACASVPAKTTAYDEGLQGLHVDAWKNADFAGPPDARYLNLPGNYDGFSAQWASSPLPGDADQTYSMRATGYLTFPSTGDYHFLLAGNDNAQVWINNKKVATATVAADGTTDGGANFYIPGIRAGETVPFRIDIANNAGSGKMALLWAPPGGNWVPFPVSATRPGYGLATTHTTADSGGATPVEVTTTSYGAKPWEGLPATVTQNPGGLALATSTTYDTLKRRTTRTLPSGSTYADAYYGNTETRANPCAAGSAAVNQAGRLKTNTAPADSSGYQIVREYVYDTAGRVVAQRIVADGNTGWTCSTYDARGRATKVTYPATADDPATAGVNEATPARTVTTSYAVGGDPRVKSISDAAGTITTASDLTEKVTTYTDATGVVTTTTYDTAGRPTGESVTKSGASSVTAFTYNDASQVTSTKLDGQVVSTPVINAATGETTGAAYGNGTTAAITRGQGGQLATLAWGMAGGRTITSSVTRSQSGRVTTDTATDSGDAASGYAWSYTYDSAARLVTANLAAQGSARPAVASSYGFDTSAAASGCSKGAGKNTNRSVQTRTVTGAPAVSTTYCYDGADRILNDSAGNAYNYDKHGNTTKVTSTATGDVTIFVYDSDDRHVKTITPNGAGGASTVTYTRDATDRIVTRAVAGSADASENGAASYGYSASGDSPDLYLSSSGAIGQRVLGLDAGATYTKDYTDASKSVWAYSNIHGDIITTSTGTTGQAAGPIVCYDPYGTPITTAGAADADGAPNTAPGAFDAGWLGQHQRYTEHTAALNYIEMGKRVYNPQTGRFMQVDPVEGGGANEYAYPTDPINIYDIDGDLWFIPVVVGFVVREAVKYGVKTLAKHIAKKAVKKGVEKVAKTTVRTPPKYVNALAKSKWVGAKSPTFGRGSWANSGRWRLGWSSGKKNITVFGARGSGGANRWHSDLLRSPKKWGSW